MCRWLARIITFALVVALGGAVAIWVGLPVWYGVRDIVAALPVTLHEALAQFSHNGCIQVFGERLDADQLTAAAISTLQPFFGARANAFAAAVTALLALMGTTLTVVLLFYYFKLARDRSPDGLAETVPVRHRVRFRHILLR